MGQVGTSDSVDRSVHPPVTTITARWNGNIVIPSGEIRPGTRTAAVLSATPLEKRAGFAILDIAILVVYFIILIGIGVYYASRERSTNDYFLGGNRITWRSEENTSELQSIMRISYDVFCLNNKKIQ